MGAGASANTSGTIGQGELKACLGQLGYDLSDERAQGLLLTLDVDGDGKVQVTDLPSAIEALQSVYSTLTHAEAHSADQLAEAIHTEANSADQMAEATHTEAHLADQLAETQWLLLEAAPPLLRPFRLAFTVFVSYPRATGQGPVGRIFESLEGDYRCFLSSAITQQHSLCASMAACNYFLFFLSEGILDNSPFCIMELLSALFTQRIIFVVRDLSFRLPNDIRGTVAEVMRSRIGAETIHKEYGWSVDDAAAKAEDALLAAWPSRITYQAEGFEQCLVHIRERLGSIRLAGPLGRDVIPRWLATAGIVEQMQPKPGSPVDLVKCNGLKELDLAGAELDADDLHSLADVLEKNSTLVVLRVNGCPLPIDELKGVKSVETIDLSSMQLDATAAVIVGTCIKGNGHLRQLNLTRNNMGDQGSRSLAVAVKVNAAIQMLNVGWNNITGQGAESLAQVVLEHTSLADFCGIPLTSLRQNSVQDLILNDKGIGLPGALVLSSLLPTATALVLLNLANNNLGAKGAATLAEALKGNTTIRRLTLDQNHLCGINIFSGEGTYTAEGITKIGEMLKINQTLQSISLECNIMGVKGLTALAAAMKVNTKIDTLNLANNNMGVKGSAKLAAAVKVNGRIQTLNLFNNHIGVKGAAALAKAMKFNTAIRTMVLQYNSLSKKAQERLKAAAPQVSFTF